MWLGEASATVSQTVEIHEANGENVGSGRGLTGCVPAPGKMCELAWAVHGFDVHAIRVWASNEVPPEKWTGVMRLG